MTLINEFENQQMQNVEAFNRIFKKTPLLGFNSDEPVEILEITKDSKRKIRVGTELLFIDLYPNQRKKIMRKRKAEKIIVKKEKIPDLPDIYKMLSPIQFMVFHAIKEVKQVDGIEGLSTKINLNRKTIASGITKLVELNLVKKEYLNGFFRMSINTQE